MKKFMLLLAGVGLFLSSCGYGKMKDQAKEVFVQVQVVDEDREDTEIDLLFQEVNTFFLYYDERIRNTQLDKAMLTELVTTRDEKVMEWRQRVETLKTQGRMSKAVLAKLSVLMTLLGANEPPLSSAGAIVGEGFSDMGAKIRKSQAEKKQREILQSEEQKALEQKLAQPQPPVPQDQLKEKAK